MTFEAHAVTVRVTLPAYAAGGGGGGGPARVRAGAFGCRGRGADQSWRRSVLARISPGADQARISPGAECAARRYAAATGGNRSAARGPAGRPLPNQRARARIPRFPATSATSPR